MPTRLKTPAMQNPFSPKSATSLSHHSMIAGALSSTLAMIDGSFYFLLVFALDDAATLPKTVCMAFYFPQRNVYDLLRDDGIVHWFSLMGKGRAGGSLHGPVVLVARGQNARTTPLLHCGLWLRGTLRWRPPYWNSKPRCATTIA